MPAPPPPPPPPPPPSLPSRGAAKRAVPPPPPPPSAVARAHHITDASMPTGLTSDTIPSLPPAPALPSPPTSMRSALPPPPPPPPPPPAPPQLPDTPPHMSSAINAKFPSFTMDVDTPLPDITNRESAAVNRTHVASIPNKPWEKSLDYGKIQHAVREPNERDDDDDDDDDDGDVDAMDIPHRFTMRPGAAAARLDLQRCTIRVHKQLVNQMQTHSMKPQPKSQSRPTTPSTADESLSRCQGELWLKSRVPMMGWKKRYGSIVDHAYFGPVLFLFKYDAKGNVALHHSLMIVLVDSHVRLGKNSTTKDNDYRCEFVLRTTKRRYTIAANHTMRRDYWLRNLESIQKQATTSYS